MCVAFRLPFFFSARCWWSHIKQTNHHFVCCHRKCGNLLFNWCSIFSSSFTLVSAFFLVFFFNAFGLELMSQKRCRTSLLPSFSNRLHYHFEYVTNVCSMNRWEKKCFPNLNWLVTELTDCCWIYRHAYTMYTWKRPTQMKKNSNYFAIHCIAGLYASEKKSLCDWYFCWERFLSQKLKKGDRILLMNWIINLDYDGYVCRIPFTLREKNPMCICTWVI